MPIHALVAGGALASAGEWKSSKRGFLFPVKALSKVFRGKFVAALKAARENGTPGGAAVLDAATWRTLLAWFFAHEWVV